MRTGLRLFLSVFALLFLLRPDSVFPCGPGEPDPLRIFRPLQITGALFPDKSADPYYVALDNLAGTCDLPDRKEPDPNLEKWNAYIKELTGVAADYDALKELVYESKPEALQSAINGSGSQALPNRLARSGGKDALSYLVFAKNLEPLVAPPISYWDTPEPPSPEKVSPYINQAIRQMSLLKDRDLKIRYFYQAMRLSHYSGQHQRALELFKKPPTELKSADPLYYRLQHLKAGALLKSGQVSSGLLELANIGARPEMMPAVLLDFKRFWHEDGAYEVALKKASGDQKKVLLILRFFASAEPGLETLAKMAELYPRDPALDYMFIREIDRLEDRLEEPLYYSYTGTSYSENRGREAQPAIYEDEDGNFSVSAFLKRVWHWFVPSLEAEPIATIPAEELRYMNRLSEFIAKTANEKNVASPGAWKLGQVYLEMLMGKHEQAARSLEVPSIQKGNSPFVKLQSRRLGLLNLAESSNKPDSQLKERILKDYDAIVSTGESHDYVCRWSDHAARLRLHRNMVEIHRRAGEEGHALLWEPDVAQIYSGTPVNTYDFPAMKKAEQVLRSPATKYDEALAKIAGTDLSNLVSRLGSRLLKAGQYADAVQAFKSIPEKKHRPMYYSERIKAGPFQNPFSDSFGSGDRAEKHTSYTIAAKMQELKRTAESSSGNQAAEAYYRMGLAQFNMSHFGNWWSAVDTDWSIYYEYSDKKGDPQLALATDYFKKSLSKASDRELIAASRFMIATIAYLDHASTDYSSDGLVSLAPEQKVQFSKLAELEDTQFYQEVIRSCTYYMNFRN